MIKTNLTCKTLFRTGVCIAFFLLIAGTSTLGFGQTTIVSWDFPSNPDNATADGGITANSTKTISLVNADAGNTLFFSRSGNTTNCFSSLDWQNGSGVKCVKFDNIVTTGYNLINFSAMMNCGNSNSPRDFQIEYSFNNGPWTAAGPAITLPNTPGVWTAVASNLSLPNASNQSDVDIRIIQTSNVSISGGGIGTGGGAWLDIDDIIIGSGYCPFTVSSGVNPLTLVTIGSINKSSSELITSPAYEDFTATAANLTAGQNYTITVKANTDGNYTGYFTAFFDWNQDGDFSDPGEAFNLGTITNSTGLDAKFTSLSIPVPAGALMGNKRMRVISKDNNDPLNCCSSTAWGQAEDYTINVVPSITTSAISGAPFCPGAAVSIPYTITGPFTAGNIFTAQLSNASGSFASPTAIGSLTSNAAGSVSGTIPPGTPTGSGYRIRVIGSAPSIVGADNGGNLIVSSIPGTPSATGSLICLGSSAALSASGAVAGDRYLWYDAVTGGTLLKTSTNNTDNIYTTIAHAVTTNYWVSILNAGGCESSRTLVTATYPVNSPDLQTSAGIDSWIGHVYDGTNNGVAYNENFTNYYGHYSEPETFDESFGGSTVCFNITSNFLTRSIYTETFSVRYRMNSTRHGLYVADLGSDDGSRLAVDGTLVYNNWGYQSWGSKPRVLINLTGSSSLVYDFYENGGGNRITFLNLTQVFANNLTTNLNQNICIGYTGTAISGDTYGALPAGITLSGTGYQWTYSTTPAGIRTNISGATGATFTPNASIAPFNVAGTYYIYRNAVLSSSNNVSPNPFVATNESNAATITVNPNNTAALSSAVGYDNQVTCISTAITNITYTTTGAAGATITGLPAGVNGSWAANSVTINGTPTLSGTFNYTVTLSGGCGIVTTSGTISVTPTVGTPVFTLSSTSTRCQGGGTVNYSATATNTSGITYSLDAASISGGNSIVAGTGAVTYLAGWNGTSIITANAAGCSGPSSASHTVTITPTVGTPVFTLGTTSTRCQGAGTVNYSATATNSTGIAYSLDAASITGGNSIVSGTGAVAFLAGWSGTSIITANATGCNGPSVASHTVTITPPVGTPAFILGTTSTRAQGASAVLYTATATNNTGITYTLDAASTGAGNSIAPATGNVTYISSWLGTSIITATALGCYGPTSSTHTVNTTFVPTFYSFQTGNWNDPNTWTFDPSGTTGPVTSVPGNSDKIVVLTGRTVSLTGDVASTNMDITLNPGGFLNQSTFRFTNTLGALRGGGTIQLASANFPTVSNNTFVTNDGGTTEYNTTGAFNLPVAQTIYYHLTVNGSTEIARQINNLVLNGNLYVKKGTFQLNDATAARRQLTIKGNLIVDATASITVGTGNTRTASDTPIGVADGGTSPYLNYYNNETHRIIIQGDITNNGIVRFTNQTAPQYDAFPITGTATVYFQGSSNNLLTCNGPTDFYNLIVDKGSDQTYKLTVYSNAYSNFRLFGANNARSANSNTANPDIKKALWVRNGTMVLQGLSVIPSLSEGTTTSGTNTANYIIPANGSLVLDGTGVIVLSTADDYTEVQAAYNLSGGSNALYGINTGSGSVSGLSVLGKLQVNNGYLSTRESSGLLYWSYSSGQFILNGGIVDTKQFHSPEAGTAGLVTFQQNSGNLILRGRFQNTISYSLPADLVNPAISTVRASNSVDAAAGIGTLHINANTSNGYITSGGTISIYDVTGTTATSYAILVGCPASNINVTGGTVQIIPTTGTALADADYLVNSLASFGNLILNRSSGTSIVQLYANPLNILQNITLQSGVFDAKSQDVTVGGNFAIASGTTYTTGTNNTIFNGSGTQTFTVNLGSALSLSTLKISKATTDILAFAGSQNIINAASLSILSGKLDDNGNTINVLGNIYNAGIHMSTPGTGKIVLINDFSVQTIDGNGAGIFQNLELNKPNSGNLVVNVLNKLSIKGILAFTGTGNKSLNLQTYNLTLGASATITGADANRYIQTNGNAGDGGITKTYSAFSSSFTYHIGAPSVKHAGVPNYSPATLSITGVPNTYGTITVVPVGSEHPNTTAKNRSLYYYWKVTSSNFVLGSATITQGYTYSQNDVPATSGDISESGFVAARYFPSAFSWTRGTTNDIDIANNIIGKPGAGTFLENVNFIDGDYTAGDDNATNPFGTPTKYYSRQSGLWNSLATWSLTSHTVTNPPTVVPGAFDIVIIGGQDSVYLATHNTVPNTDVRSCASIQIEVGSALDIGYNPNCSFGTVRSHANGNGNFRLTTSYADGSTYAFPSGDFSDFNVNLGTTELYSTNSTAGTTYWLPNGVSSYGNLILSPVGGSNIIFPNNDLTIYGNLITRGQNADSWFCPAWNLNYPTAPTIRIAKTITINGNMEIQGGALIFYGYGAVTQNFVIYGDVIVAPNAALYMYSGASSQNMSIGGSLVNNTVGTTAGGTTTVRKCDFTSIPLTFFGSNSAVVTNTLNNPLTIFSQVTVNKGTSQATTLTIDIGGTLTTLTNNWLTLQNGTLRYMRTNPGTDFAISTTTPFIIPSTSGLYVDYTNSGNKNILIANGATNTNDLLLYGKLTLLNGNIYVGPTNRTTNSNNDIEYSSGGASTIDVRGGNLFVNGQIRRNPSNAGGILNFNQSGGVLTINGQSPTITNAKLEVLNAGSSFNMSAGTLNFVKGGGTSFGDLYLRPQTGSVTGGLMQFNPGSNGAQTYQLESNIPLNNLTLSGSAANVATLKLMVSPLILNGNCIIGSNTVFNANNINTTFNGNFTNSVGVTGYLTGTNLTTFSATNSSSYLGAQSLSGATNFNNLTINPGASLTVNASCNVAGDMILSSGTLLLASNLIQVSGNFTNNGRYTDANTANTGVQLMGTVSQHISGNGNFGRLEINNISGTQLDNSIYLEEDLALTTGIFDINKYLLSLGLNSNIQGTSFTAAKMITTDGVFSSLGVRKLFPAGNTGSFLYPLGTTGKYTPAVLLKTASNTVGYVQIINVNKMHPSVIDPANALNYYWEVTSSGITGFTGNIVFNYQQSDVKGAQENNYLAARLIVPGTSWSETNTVDAVNNKITFNLTTSNNLGGEYTAGISAAFPPDVPIYTSNKNGNWTDKTIWTQTGGTNYPCPDGGPNGFIVIINHEVIANSNYCQAYRTTINNKLKIVSPYFGHNLGSVDGSGTLYLESGSFPAGVYTSFLDCANNGTIEYSGTGTYSIVADLYNSIPNMLVSGSGTRILPAKNLTICKSLKINGPTLDNSINNRTLYIQGTMEISTGAFNSGTGSNATVSFAGSSAQTIGGALGNFTGSNAFNNFEINNSSGLTVNTSGAIEVNGELRLTDGLINTNPDVPYKYGTLTITNPAIACVIPTGGSSSSFINGPLTKQINQGDDFLYPVGIYKSGTGNIAGNKLSLSSTKTGTILWTASYYNPNPTFASFTAPIMGVSSKEFWNVKALAGSKAVININWDSQSDITPLVTQNGLSDMTIGSYQAGSWVRINSSATGNDYNGTASTNAMVTSAGSNDYTLAALSTLRAKAKLDPLGPTCGNAGIPVTFVSQLAIPLNFTLNYTIDGVAQPQIVVSSLPYTLPTPVPGIYKLTAFTFNNGAGTGVVDASSITVNTVPTVSDAGPDQALCGITSAYLNANPLGITSGTGVWSIISGNGGTLITPTSRTSQIIGLNGTSYKLRWTISNGSCKSTDDVIINFNLVPLAPSASANQTICANSIVADIQVTPPSGSTVTWYSVSSGGTALSGSQSLVSGDYYAESNGGTGCQSLSRTKVTVTVIPMVWTGSSGIDWNVASNWSCGFVPTINSVVQIPNVANKPVLSAGATGAVKNITIDVNSSVTITGNTMQISGSITNNGTFNSTAGTIEMKGSAAQFIPANVFSGNNIGGLTITNAAGVTLLGPLKVTGIVYAQTGNLVSSGNLTLASSATQTALIDGTGTGAVTGNVTMHRYLPSGFGYKYFSSPFQAATVNEFANDLDLAAAFPTFYKYDEDNHRDSSGVSIYTTGWSKYVTAANPLAPTTGYAANFGNASAAKTVDMTGVVNNNILTSQTLYNRNRTYTKGFNLIGNPYPSPIDWNASSGWTKSNIDNALYYFDAGTVDQYTGTYSTYINGISSNGIANGIIPSMQGFFIHVSNGTFPVTASLGMDNRVRVNNLTPVFHKSDDIQTQPLVRLSATYKNGKTADPVVVYFDDLATTGFDPQLDALKLMNTDVSVPNLYMLTPQSDKLSISAMPFPGESITKIPLGLKTEQGEVVTFKASDIKYLPIGLNVYFSDEATGRIQDLQMNHSYDIQPGKGTLENRFFLVFSNKEEAGTLNDKNALFANIANGKLNVYVNLNTESDSRLVVSNVLGQVMLQKSLYGNGMHEIEKQLPAGIYILALYSQQGISSCKIFIPK